MKKQTELLTTTLARPKASRLQLIFLVVIATVFYRNYSNRRLSGMPPNSLGLAKQTLQSVVSESEKLVSKLSNFFYNVTGESMQSIFQFLAIAGLLVALVIGIVYIIRTH